MNILCIADLHHFSLDELIELNSIDFNNVDGVLLLGDIHKNLLGSIKNFVTLGTPIYGVKGDHDRLDVLDLYGIQDIHSKVVSLGKYSLCGLELHEDVKTYDDIVSKDRLYDEILNHIGRVDIIITHNSPYGIHDKKCKHTGFSSLIKYSKIHKPKLIIHGHQHVNNRTLLLSTKTMVISVYGVVLLNTETFETKIIFRRKTILDK